jgi:hypothetical protein
MRRPSVRRHAVGPGGADFGPDGFLALAAVLDGVGDEEGLVVIIVPFLERSRPHTIARLRCPSRRGRSAPPNGNGLAPARAAAPSRSMGNIRSRAVAAREEGRQANPPCPQPSRNFGPVATLDALHGAAAAMDAKSFRKPSKAIKVRNLFRSRFSAERRVA